MPKSRFLKVANMSFYANHKNKILAKISEFTVFKVNMQGRPQYSFANGRVRIRQTH